MRANCVYENSVGKLKAGSRRTKVLVVLCVKRLDVNCEMVSIMGEEAGRKHAKIKLR